MGLNEGQGRILVEIVGEVGKNLGEVHFGHNPHGK
jgi:hypothetical protein